MLGRKEGKMRVGRAQEDSGRCEGRSLRKSRKKPSVFVDCGGGLAFDVVVKIKIVLEVDLR
jgi:hypothetical protein